MDSPLKDAVGLAMAALIDWILRGENHNCYSNESGVFTV